MNKIKRKSRPKFSKSIKYKKGLSCFNKEEYEKALKYFGSSHRSSPSYPFACANAALAYQVKGDFDNAAKFARWALRSMDTVSPKDPPLYIQALRVHANALSIGTPAIALEHYQQTVTCADDLIEQEDWCSSDVKFQKAHVLNEWGATLIKLERFDSAVEILQSARELYEELKEYVTVGLTETLTNLGIALHTLGEETRAGAALQAAKGYAESRDNSRQVWTIKVTAAQQNAHWIDRDRLDVILDAAENAQDPHTTHIRLCIGARLACDQDRADDGLEFIRHAKEYENDLPLTLNVAKLRGTEGELLQKQGKREKAISTLSEGSDKFYDILVKGDREEEIPFISTKLHNPARRLSLNLLEESRISEAFVAFECGRAISFAHEVSPLKVDRYFNENPFNADGYVSLAPLEPLQNRLNASEVALSITLLPPYIVCFIVGGSEILTVTEEVVEDERSKLPYEIRDIPVRLNEGVGDRAIPDLIKEFGAEILDQIGGKSIDSLSPYGSFHSVPWRSIFRDAGASWSQLSFPVTFNNLLRTEPSFSIDRITALGAESPPSFGGDLPREAKLFAEKTNGNLVENCRADDLQAHLQDSGLVMVSCHGKVQDRAGANRLLLSLSDGKSSTKEWCPEIVEASVVVLSACESGVYRMAYSDYPVGAAPELLLRGADACLCTRFGVNADFASRFSEVFGEYLSNGHELTDAFTLALSQEEGNSDLWEDIACLELISR